MTITSLAEALKKRNSTLDNERAIAQAKELTENLDPRLMPNLKEWVEGKEISDLWIGKYCVNAVMDIRGSKDFISALNAMNLYLKDENAGVRVIWRGRR